MWRLLLLGLNRALTVVFDKATKYVVSSVKVYVFFFGVHGSPEITWASADPTWRTTMQEINWLSWLQMGQYCPYGVCEKCEEAIWVITVIGKILLVIRRQVGQECWMVSSMLRKSHSTKYCSVLNDSLMFYHIYIEVKILSIIFWT